MFFFFLLVIKIVQWKFVIWLFLKKLCYNISGRPDLSFVQSQYHKTDNTLPCRRVAQLSVLTYHRYGGNRLSYVISAYHRVTRHRARAFFFALSETRCSFIFDVTGSVWGRGRRWRSPAGRNSGTRGSPAGPFGRHVPAGISVRTARGYRPLLSQSKSEYYQLEGQP